MNISYRNILYRMPVNPICLPFLCGLALVSLSDAVTTVSISGDDFLINGRPTYEQRAWNGHRIEGLLFNNRVVQGTFDDLNTETVSRWVYPDTGRWDPERNIREFLAAMPEWKRHGVLGFTVNFQGGSPEGYSKGQPWENHPFNPDGSLRLAFMDRMKRILDEADRLGMVPIVGYFYFGQSGRLKTDETAIRATDALTQWLLEGGWRNILVEINNESNPGYRPPILRPDRVHELIARVRDTKTRDGRRLLVGTSFPVKTMPTVEVMRTSDFVLLHGNGFPSSLALVEKIRATRALDPQRRIPVVINEDDHNDFNEPAGRLASCVAEHVSWGWFDWRRNGEGFDQGYQSVPVNWNISSDRKRNFYARIAGVTGAHIAGPVSELEVGVMHDAPPIQFAAEEIRSAAARSVLKPPAFSIILCVGTDPSPSESYRIERQGETVVVTGRDAVGAMYGGLDIAEAIGTGTLDALKDSDHTPHIAQRGIKFNIPLDLRTPSYSDCSDAAQANIPEMWERQFWIEFLDAMARHRYNVLSLWSLHPFPSLVKVPEFPEVALADVWRTRVKLDDTFSFAGSDMVRPAMLADHEVVKRMTMDEKIEFWRWITQQAADRGIRIYIFTWNVFTFGAEGKHGITSDLGNEITKRYFRASVREMVKTYPLLAGMGITAGEGMPEKMDSKSKETWLWDTYGQGVRDALKDDTKRQFGMIHRFHWTVQGDILDTFKDYPGPFEFSFKYSVAHMYSIPNPPFIQPLLENLAPGKKTWLTVRNDDIYTFRFGDPAYAREYILNMPPADKLAGFYMGPDGYVWGRDFLERHPDTDKRPLVMEKQWYSFMLLGRLAYDPSLPDSHFEKILAARHPTASSPHLFGALQGASQVMPLVTRFFWGDIDLKWYPEACLSHRRSKGFYTVRHFMEGITMPGSEVLCIRDWRNRLTARQPMEQTTPLEIADALDGAVSQTFASLEALREAAKNDSELRKTVTDCQALAWLGRYYASKIRGACALALFDASDDKFEHEAALRYLGDALAHWKKYAAIRDAHYVPALYNRVGFVNVTALTEKVAADIDIARNWKPGTLKDDGKRAGSEKGFRK